LRNWIRAMPNLSQRDDRLMSLCELALRMPAPQREAGLRAATAGDTGLFEEVWTRVQWEERLGDFLLEPLAPPRDLDHPLTPGQLLADRFEIVREVAEGGMAVVYEAIDRKLNQRIAIKCPKTVFRRRLPPEARHALQVSHPNICRVYEIHTATTDRGEFDFLTMEFLEGETMLERLAREKRLPREKVCTLGRQICAGLEEAHHKGIIHGDLKTSNVILVATESGVRAVITDFGLAKQMTRIGGGPPLAYSSQLRGTPDFVAPELWQGSPVSVASDIYALGVILYEALSGVRPWEGEPLYARFERAPKPPERAATRVPPRWTRVVLRCLDPKPENRPTSAAAVAEELAQRSRAKVWAALAAVVMLCLLGSVLILRQEPARPIRLALLPFKTDADSKVLATGIMEDISSRLIRARRTRSLVVIPPNEATQDLVRDHKTALAVLGATHTLQVSFRKSGEKLHADAEIWNAEKDLRSGSLSTEYLQPDLLGLPEALLGAVTATLQLSNVSFPEQVRPAAYRDYLEGLYYLRRDSHTADLAIPSLERAAHLDESSALPLTAVAEAQMLKFQTSQDRQWLRAAEETLGRAWARNPDATEVHMTAGLVKHAAGRYEQAREEFRLVIDREPANPDALRRLARVYQALQMPTEAVQTFRQAILIQPGYFRPHNELAGFYYTRGQYINALEEFQVAARLAPRVPETHLNSGAAYAKLGRFQEAEAEIREALRLRENRDALAALGALFAYQKRHAESVFFYERAVELGPATCVPVTNLGEAYRRIGRAAEARGAYERALRIADEQLLQVDTDGFARAMAGYLSARLGDRSRAQREIARALRLAPDDAYVIRSAVLTYEVLGNRDASIQLLERAPQVADDLSRQPDLADLQRDSRFLNLMSQFK
jgi:serine/threonine protein kinase/tetratricopeptide (TPR) repeat protein